MRETLEDQIMDALRYYRREHARDGVVPGAAPMDMIGSTLGAEESEMVAAVNRLDKRGWLQAVTVPGLGVYLTATDRGMEAPDAHP